MGEDVDFSSLIVPEWCSRDFGVRFHFPSWKFGPFDFFGSGRSQQTTDPIDHDGADGTDLAEPK